MAQRDRIELLEKTLIENRSVTVSAMSERFGVTEETIRRDLEKLEKKGVLTRTYGGAVLNSDYLSQGSIHFNLRSQINQNEKRLIAQKAAALLTTESTIGMDSSSTALAIVRCIEDTAGKTLVTNSVGVLVEAAQVGIHALSTGGFLDAKSMSLHGIAAQNTMQSYHMDISFLGCKALSMEAGMFDSNEHEAVVKNAMIKQSQKVVLVADHTKFDKISFVRTMRFEDIDAVVTDQRPSEAWCAYLQKQDIELIF